jgi:hypothetical protein
LFEYLLENEGVVSESLNVEGVFEGFVFFNIYSEGLVPVFVNFCTEVFERRWELDTGELEGGKVEVDGLGLVDIEAIFLKMSSKEGFELRFGCGVSEEDNHIVCIDIHEVEDINSVDDCKFSEYSV